MLQLIAKHKLMLMVVVRGDGSVWQELGGHETYYVLPACLNARHHKVRLHILKRTSHKRTLV